MLALLGRNGAGKTTCMHVDRSASCRRAAARSAFGRAGSTRPAAGGDRAAGASASCRRAGACSRRLTVRENLVVAARDAGEAAASPGRSNASTGSSRGCGSAHAAARRLALRRRAADAGDRAGADANPRVLLLDEPSEGLAPQIVVEVRATLGRLKEQGLSILLVEQNLKLAFELADDSSILNTGQVVYDGPVAGVRADPALLSKHLGVESVHV